MDSSSTLIAGFALLGGVFVLTTSSQKSHSIWHKNYPKRTLEGLMGLFCASSDSRLLALSIGLVVTKSTGEDSYLLWLIWVLAAVTYLNFLIRIGLVHHHFGDGQRPES